MAAEIVQINSQDFSSQNYKTQDVNLITSFPVGTFLSASSYVEFFIYDNNKNILNSDYNFIQYTVLADGQSAGLENTISTIQMDPEAILVTEGYSQGVYNTYFNFFNKQIGSNLQQLYITEISSDRTEIRLDSTSLTDIDIIEQANSLIQQREDSPYFLDFYLNFGENQLAIANNIQLDDQDPINPTILIKLYEALPEQFNLNSTLWVVTLIEEPVAYQVSFPPEPIVLSDTIPLNGPNFNLDVKDQINNSTVSLDYTTLTSTALTSSRNQLKSLLEEKGIDINVDYTNFSDFIHFSSVQSRLENFYYKMSLLEDYSSSIATLNNTTNNNPSDSIALYEALSSNIITNFDEYDYYLYYSSGSWAWPKTTSQPPYQLATTGSAAVLNWFGSSDEDNAYYGGISLSASNYDNLNINNLYYSIPEYLRNDPANEPYQIFVEMVGQFYDNIWVYYKDVTQKYNADNRLESGISKDIVADAIRDFGIKLYQNNFSNDDLYTAFIGLTPQGGLFPFPNITGSLPTPSGFEYVDTLISASNDYIPLDDVNKSLYKRIYHNLPYLLKAKGTLPGLRTLITSYGIPDTVLRINEYGGKDKSNVNDWDYWQNTFNYAYHNVENSITTDWILNPNWDSADRVPSTLEFRFKVPNLAVISGSAAVDLWSTNTTSKIRLRYTGSGLVTSSYSGSIPNPEYQFTHLDFFPNFTGAPTLSASVYLPFANEGWWSVMATRDGSNFGLYAGNNIYEGGENGTQLGFYASSSVTVVNNAWTGGLTSLFMPQDGIEMYLQEIRYYNTVLSESVFKDYIMNPYSSEGNNLNSSPDQLAFRLTLGGELYTGSVSIHPKITGSWIATSSFTTNSSASFASTPIFVPNEEQFFFDQPVVGIKNAISDKIRLENSVIPTGSVLSPFRSLAQNLAASQSYTANTNLLEVAFSPQDEINDDIVSQIGYFEIGELIGDPRLRSSSATSYPDLDALRNAYFEKYTKNYDLNDFIRLIKFFDNSLFKMIKDFVPARTSLASGVVIKQHLLERNKYPQPQTNIDSTIAYYGSGSQNNLPFVFQNIEVSGTVAPQWNDYNPGTIENFSGGTGGTMDMFNGLSTSPSGILGAGPNNIFFITQSWVNNTVTPSGSVPVLHDSQDEFYNGEFSGSALIVTTQSLAQSLPLDLQSLIYNISGSSQLFNPFQAFPPLGTINWQGATYISSSYISYLYINENSLNGINISTALSNLESGDQIILSVSASVDDGPFQGISFESTTKGTITSINNTSPSVWRIDFSSDPTLLAVVYNIQYPNPPNATPLYPGLYPSSSTFLIPFLNDISNFYNSDYNPLINNVLIDRLSTIYQDVDYSSGITTPTNFDLLISGSALKAAVQDSNYTSKRVTLPRYEGVKSTSQHLNYWTPGDSGTYGKLPTVENLKTMVAYCEDVSGWPPERENASAASVKYLIKSDGSVVIPNTTPNSLYDNKGTFESGENILIHYQGIGNQVTPLRKVIRGGTRIEPILYNQSGSMPGGTFVSSITLTDNGVTGNVISDFQAKLRPTSYILNPLSISPTFSEICFNQILTSGSAASVATTTISGTTSYRYKINSSVLSEGVDFTFEIYAEVTYTGATPTPNGNNYAYYQLRIVRWRGGNKTVLTTGPSIQLSSPYTPSTLSITVPVNNLQLNDEFTIEAVATDPNVFLEPTSRFNINQNPIPNSNVPITPNFWISSSGLATTLIKTQTSGAFGDNLLISISSSALINYYGNPTVYQESIVGSGFNPIVLPWSIQYGDEFRFEGREDRVYQVKQAAIVTLQIFSTQIPLLVVEMNQPLAISGSVNYNQFLIRRYVDDASQILIEGFRPLGASGPYILKPEYITPELDKGVDDFVLILKEKGLI
jgi:hypothetical protein